ncbi:MAG TPA: AtpZ/AtpI family protein [Hyphomicrobiales bacterium]|nr:AtpZ/AtpI family protein [Hyphomicrobiales bacterium]
MASDRGGDDGRKDESGAGWTPDESFKSRLRDLDTRLRSLKREKAGPVEAERRGSTLGLALRLVVELVAGLVVGGAIGWFLDYWLGTLPILFLLFFALGAAAGILNVIRTARQMQSGMGPLGEDLEPRDEDD